MGKRSSFSHASVAIATALGCATSSVYGGEAPPADAGIAPTRIAVVPGMTYGTTFSQNNAN